MSASLSPATKASYRRSLSQFVSLGFSSASDRCLTAPASSVHVLRFIAALYQQGLSASTIRSKLSAVAYWHNIHAWSNPVDSFVVRKHLLGVANSQPPSLPTRLPVTPALLASIHDILSHVTETVYDLCLFRAVFLLAFFDFLQVSEYT